MIPHWIHQSEKSIVFLILGSSMGLGMYSYAAQTTVTLPTVLFTEGASFETLQSESLIPKEKIPLETSRGSTLDELKWKTPFPTQNYGYPSGASGVSLGGRSIDDTQVTTLGIPLNLPQGGGADLSYFPSFLWSEATISSSTTSAGFSQQSVSGTLDLVPWTWSILKPAPPPEASSRITLNYDRDIQSFSIGTRKSDLSILAGSTFGRQAGPAGSLSFRFLKTPQWTLIANVIGSDQEGESPGSTDHFTPRARKKSTRVLPSLVSQWRADSDLVFQMTFFADLQSLNFTNPDESLYDSFDRIQTYGAESAIIFHDTTLALSARQVNFENNSAGSFTEWPAHLGLTQAFRFSSGTLIKTTASADYLSGYAIYAGGRISAQFPLSKKEAFFSEFQAIPKFPSILDRLYILPPDYHGNPDLLPEQVYSVIFGYEDEASLIKTKTQVKAEHRTDLILSTPDFSTTMNSGSGNFLSLSHNAKVRITKSLQTQGQFLASYSRLDSTGRPYPRLPSLSAGGVVMFTPSDTWGFQTQVKWMGDSTESDGAPLSNYLLAGERVTFTPQEEIQISLGVDNVFDSRAEAIRNYPLPGRIVYASTELHF